MKRNENLVRITEANEHIDFSVKTLRNWRCSGKYPQLFRKVGGKVFIDLEEFDKIIEQDKQNTINNAKRLGLLD